MRICCTCMFFFPKTSDQNRLTLSCRLVLHRPLASDQAVHLPCLSQGGAKDAGGCHETDVEDASLVCFLTVLRGIWYIYIIYIIYLYYIHDIYIIYTRTSIRMGFDLFALRSLHVDGETCNILSKPAQRWCLMEWQYKAYQIMWLRNYKMVMWQSSKPVTLGRYFFQWLGKFEHTESIRNTIIDEPCKFANLCEEPKIPILTYF